MADGGDLKKPRLDEATNAGTADEVGDSLLVVP